MLDTTTFCTSGQSKLTKWYQSPARQIARSGPVLLSAYRPFSPVRHARRGSSDAGVGTCGPNVSEAMEMAGSDRLERRFQRCGWLAVTIGVMLSVGCSDDGDGSTSEPESWRWTGTVIEESGNV